MNLIIEDTVKKQLKNIKRKKMVDYRMSSFDFNPSPLYKNSE